MRARISMREALRDPALLGNVLKGPSWFGWRTLLIAAAGEKLTTKEREIFTKLTGRAHEPLELCRELIVIAGRRSGKTSALAVFMVWVACLCDHRKVLAPGETGTALCLSRDQKIAGIILDRCEGAIQESAQLRSLIVNRTASVIELKDHITIEVRACNYRTVRGLTCICVVADEIAHWRSGENYDNPDFEIMTAIRPALKSTRGPILMASSAYARTGVLYDSYSRYFGPDGPADTLVAYATSRDLNPQFTEEEIAREIERDPANKAEYLSIWRDDVEGFISREIVERCVGDYVELPPQDNVNYHMLVDPASGVDNGDAYAMAVTHRVDQQIIVDAVREITAPFSPAAVISDVLVPLAKAYRIYSIWGDNAGANFAQEPIRVAGLQYEKIDRSKSQLYQSPFLPLLNSRLILLPKIPRLISQICSLERNVPKGGGEQITHPPRGHDDVANAVAGAAALAYDTLNYNYNMSQWLDDPPGQQGNRAYPAQQLAGLLELAVQTGGGSLDLGRQFDWSTRPRQMNWNTPYQSPFRRGF